MAQDFPHILLSDEKTTDGTICNEIITTYVLNNEIVFMSWFLGEVLISGNSSRAPLSIAHKKDSIVLSSEIEQKFSKFRLKENVVIIAEYALLNAVANGLFEMVERLLLHVRGINLSWAHPKTGDTPLLMAIKTRRVEMFRLLTDHGADIYQENEKTRDSPWKCIVEGGCKPLLREFLLLDDQFDINQEICFDIHQNEGKFSSIIFATRRGHVDIVKEILDTKRVDIESVREAMLLAREYSRTSVLYLLQNHLVSCNVPVVDEGVTTADLTHKSWKNMNGTLNYLSKLFFPTSWSELKKRVCQGNVGLVKEFLEKSKDCAITNEIIHHTIELDDVDILEVFMKHKEEILEGDMLEFWKNAIVYGSKKCLAVLLERCEPKKIESLILNLMEVAIQTFREADILEMISFDASTEQIMIDIMYSSIYLGNPCAANFTFKRKETQRLLQDPEKLKGLFCIASSRQYLLTMDVILDRDKLVSYKEAKVEEIPLPYELSPGVEAVSVLALAVHPEYLALLAYLTSRAFNFKQFSFDSYTDKNGYTKFALLDAVKLNSFTAVRLLLKVPDLRLDVRDRDKNTALHCCLSEEVALELLRAPKIEKIIDKKNKAEETPLEKFLRRRWYDSIEVMLQSSRVRISDVYYNLCWEDSDSLPKLFDMNCRPKNINAPLDIDGVTIFMRACQKSDGNPDNVLLLLTTFPDLLFELKDNKNASGLHYACKYGLVEAVEYLFEKTYPLPSLNTIDEEGFSVLLAAVHSGCWKLVKLLLTHPHVNFKLQHNRETTIGTAITYAADLAGVPFENSRKDNSRSLVLKELLICKDIDLNVPHNGVSVMMKLSSFPNLAQEVLEGIKERLEAGDVDCNHKNPDDGNAALHICARFGTRGLMLLLLAHEAIEIDSLNRESKTPLHIATESCHEEIVRLLLASGADSSRRDDEGRTPLDIAQMRSFPEITKLFNPLLLKRQISVSTESGQA